MDSKGDHCGCIDTGAPVQDGKIQINREHLENHTVAKRSRKMQAAATLHSSEEDTSPTSPLASDCLSSGSSSTSLSCSGILESTGAKSMVPLQDGCEYGEGGDAACYNILRRATAGKEERRPVRKKEPLAVNATKRAHRPPRLVGKVTPSRVSRMVRRTQSPHHQTSLKIPQTAIHDILKEGEAEGSRHRKQQGVMTSTDPFSVQAVSSLMSKSAVAGAAGICNAGRKVGLHIIDSVGIVASPKFPYLLTKSLNNAFLRRESEVHVLEGRPKTIEQFQRGVQEYDLIPAKLAHSVGMQPGIYKIKKVPIKKTRRRSVRMTPSMRITQRQRLGDSTVMTEGSPVTKEQHLPPNEENGPAAAERGEKNCHKLPSDHRACMIKGAVNDNDIAAVDRESPAADGDGTGSVLEDEEGQRREGMHCHPAITSCSSPVHDVEQRSSVATSSSAHAHLSEKKLGDDSRLDNNCSLTATTTNASASPALSKLASVAGTGHFDRDLGSNPHYHKGTGRVASNVQHIPKDEPGSYDSPPIRRQSSRRVLRRTHLRDSCCSSTSAQTTTDSYTDTSQSVLSMTSSVTSNVMCSTKSSSVDTSSAPREQRKSRDKNSRRSIKDGPTAFRRAHKSFSTTVSTCSETSCTHSTITSGEIRSSEPKKYRHKIRGRDTKMEVANDEKNHSTDVVTSVVDKGNAKTTMGSACLKREPEELKTPTTDAPRANKHKSASCPVQPQGVGAAYPVHSSPHLSYVAETAALAPSRRCPQMKHHHHHHCQKRSRHETKSESEAYASSPGDVVRLPSAFLPSPASRQAPLPRSYDSLLRVNKSPHRGHRSAHILSTSSSERQMSRAAGTARGRGRGEPQCHDAAYSSIRNELHGPAAGDSTESEPIIPPERMKLHAGNMRKRLSWRRRLHLKRMMIHNQAKALAQQSAIDLLFRTKSEGVSSNASNRRQQLESSTGRRSRMYTGVVRAAQLLDKPLTLSRNIEPADSSALKRPASCLLRNKGSTLFKTSAHADTAGCSSTAVLTPGQDTLLAMSTNYMKKLLGIVSPLPEGMVDLPILRTDSLPTLTGGMPEQRQQEPFVRLVGEGVSACEEGEPSPVTRTTAMRSLKPLLPAAVTKAVAVTTEASAAELGSADRHYDWMLDEIKRIQGTDPTLSRSARSNHGSIARHTHSTVQPFDGASPVVARSASAQSRSLPVRFRKRNDDGYSVYRPTANLSMGVMGRCNPDAANLRSVATLRVATGSDSKPSKTSSQPIAKSLAKKFSRSARWS